MSKSESIPWLSMSLPKGWERCAVRTAFKIRLGKMLQSQPAKPSDTEVPYLKAQHVRWGTVITSDLPLMWATPSEIEAFQVAQGDLLICEGGEVGRAARIGSLGSTTIIQNALHRVRPQRTNSTAYLMYVLQHAAHAGWFEVVCNKATIAHLTVEKLGALEIPLPESRTQIAIAGFLDRKTAAIDALIEKKERLIELLQEKRQALITQAVTKGLDPSVPMKDSGVEWLGAIPKHWTLSRLGREGHFIAGAGFPHEHQGEQGLALPFFKVGDMGRSQNELDLEDANNSITIETARLLRARICPPGAIAFAKVGAALLLNRRRRIKLNSVFDNNMMAFVPRSASSRFIQFYLSLVDFGQWSNPGPVPSINEGALRDIPLPFPPTDEQDVIGRYCESVHRSIRLTENSVRTQLNALVEYRQALISAAVSGELEIPEHEGLPAGSTAAEVA